MHMNILKVGLVRHNIAISHCFLIGTYETLKVKQAKISDGLKGKSHYIERARSEGFSNSFIAQNSIPIRPCDTLSVLVLNFFLSLEKNILIS